MEIRRGVRQGCYISPISFNLYGEWIGGMIINKMGFVDCTAIIEELQTMVNGKRRGNQHRIITGNDSIKYHCKMKSVIEN